jgi:Fuc2NAc and GlcNAc transferase
MTDWFPIPAAFLASLLLTAAVRRYAISRQMLDVPNRRSSHEVPTPRGGGLAIVLTYTLGCVLLGLAGQPAVPVITAVVPAGVLVAAVGFLDDHGDVGASVRMLTQFIALLWALWWMSDASGLQLVAADGILWAGLTVLSILSLLWFVNLFNFMDGIDGLAASEAVFLCLAGAWLAGEQPGGLVSPVLFLLLAAAVTGFLPWNWPPARIFLGDVGSGFLGLMLGLLAYAAASEGGTIWPWLILPGVFVTDATLTLLHRMWRREAWHQPHRSHAYQWSARRWGHRAVTLAVTGLNVLWLLPLGFLAFRRPDWGAIILITAYFPLAVAALRLGAGRAENVRKVRHG